MAVFLGYTVWQRLSYLVDIPSELFDTHFRGFYTYTGAIEGYPRRIPC